MVFLDPVAVDFGKTSLAWLLTALPEPQFSLMQRNCVRQSMTAFSRLAAASWVGANVAKTAHSYLKDQGTKETQDDPDKPKKQPCCLKKKKKKKKKKKEDGEGEQGSRRLRRMFF